MGIGTITQVSNVTGTVNQTAGTASITTLVVGGIRGSTGFYNLQGGTLSIGAGGEFTVGDQTGSIGTFNQSSGTLQTDATSATTIGNSGQGTYNLSGGTATFNAGMLVGAQGTINQTGGSLTIASGEILDLSTTGSSYNLNGGVLIIDGSGLVGGAHQGTFNFGGGTLQNASGLLIDDMDGTVTGLSTIDTTNGNVTLTGNLTGTGGFNIVGGNTLDLAPITGNMDSFTGTSIISNGTLNAAAATFNAFSTLEIGSGGAGATGVFNLDASGGTNILSGNIVSNGTADSGVFNINFGATTDILKLTGIVDYEAVTNLSGGGTLQIYRGIMGDITGAGSVEIGDALSPQGGMVGLTGANSYSGPTTIDATYTLLATNLPHDVTNNGILGYYTTTPYATGPIMIGGNLTSPGTLLVNTAGNVSDTYVVGGTADLTGGTVSVAGYGTSTAPLVVVSAGFMDGTDPNAVPIVKATGGQLLYYVDQSTVKIVDNHLEFSTVEVPTADYATTPNQRAVSGTIDPILNNPALFFPTGASGFAPLANALHQLDSPEQIAGALDQLSPESLQYARNISFENSTVLVQHLNGYLTNLRNGYSGLDTSGLSMLQPGFNSGLGRSMGSLLAYNDPAPNGVNYYPSDFDNAGSPGSGQTMSDSAHPLATATPPRPFYAPGPSPVFSEFVSGDVILADMNRDQSNQNAPPAKASYTAGDVAAGISFRMTSDIAAGVLFDYNNTDAKTDSNGSRIKVNTYSPGAYATYFKDGFHINALFAYGYNDYTNTRNIDFGGLGATANSSPNGNQYVTNVDLGYDFHPDKHWTLGPTLGVTYTHLDVDSFTENGAGAADLTVNAQHADSVRSRLGGQIAYSVHSGPVLFQPNVSLAWQHEYLNDSAGITSQFSIPGSSPFTIQTASPSRDSALLSLGATATLDNSMALYLNYFLDVGAEDYYAQSVEGGFKARF